MSSSNRDRNLDAALAYARRGWGVLPLYSIRRECCTCGRDDCTAGKHPRTARGAHDATTDQKQIEEWWERWPDANIGIATGEASGFFVLDVDPRNGGEESLKKLERQIGRLPKTIESETGGGGWHILFKHHGFPIKRSSGALGPGLDIIGEGGYVVAPPSGHVSGDTYRWRKNHSPDGVDLAEAPRGLLDWLRDQDRRQGEPAARGDGTEPIVEGQRNATLTSIAGRLRHAGLDEAALAAALLTYNDEHCNPPLPDKEVESIVHSVAKYTTENIPVWPKPLGEAAYHGLAGEFVRLVGPQTEADEAALLLQFLTGVGNLIGRHASFRVGKTDHYTNLNCVLVGLTSKGRKGTAWDFVKSLLIALDETWKDRLVTGLSSGEGLIEAVRDPRTEKQPVKERGRVVDYQEVIVDPGVSDKRLLVFEEEFAKVLRVMNRDGNILSAVLRSAWDHGNLRTLTRNSPLRATSAHISVLSHITKDELLRYLNPTEMASGFANRFMWVCVQRKRELPEGGDVDETELDRLRGKLKALRPLRGQMDRDDETRERWRDVYHGLSEGKPGLVGAITNRAEAQVRRLELVYASLDNGADIINRVHLEAALEVWRYCADSCAYIFGTHSGDPVTEKIITTLRAHPEGLTRNELRDLFGRNLPSSRIEQALGALEGYGLIRSEAEHETGGRPSTRWRIVR